MTLKDFLAITSSDDDFLVNINRCREQLFFGYTDEIPETLYKLIIKHVYIDWASECLGIKVK